MVGTRNKNSMSHTGNHTMSYPSSDTFFIIPVWFSKYFFQIPLLDRNNEKFDQRNEKEGECKGYQSSLHYRNTQEDGCHSKVHRIPADTKWP